MLDGESAHVFGSSGGAVVGATSKGQLARRCAVTLADRLGRPVVEFPGDHGGFVALPEQCAQVLDQVLTQPT